MQEGSIVYVTCPAREVQSLVTELEDWFRDQQAVKTLLYGITPKERQGFLFLSVDGTVPPEFREKLREDSGVFDFVVCPRSTFTQQ